jgi:hypothetical protein
LTIIKQKKTQKQTTQLQQQRSARSILLALFLFGKLNSHMPCVKSTGLRAGRPGNRAGPGRANVISSKSGPGRAISNYLRAGPGRAMQIF